MATSNAESSATSELNEESAIAQSSTDKIADESGDSSENATLAQ